MEDSQNQYEEVTKKQGQLIQDQQEQIEKYKQEMSQFSQEQAA